MLDVARRWQANAVRRWLPLALALLVVGGTSLYIVRGLRPYRQGAEETVTVQVAAGTSMKQVADLLHDQHLIRNPLVFRYYARLRHLDNRLQPGEYELSPGMSPAEILQRLTDGDVVVHKVTIPEGMTIEEIADLLDAQGVVSRDEFLAAAASSHLADEYLPADVELAQPLEGYLFPATYEYQTGITAEELIAMMFERFQQVWTPELLQRAEELNMSVHEVMTLASIIEEEAQVADERARISGVYHNRLAAGMKLDADPTVAYAVGKLTGEELTLEDLAVDSPYNTYLYAGLPPGPIACPGEDSIRAALYPEENDYWYFVARGDGSGRHFFAETLEEQEANIEKYRANLTAREGSTESDE